MGHVVTKPILPFEIAGGAGRVFAVPAASDNLIWVVACAATGHAAIVDGPPEVEAVLSLLAEQGLTLSWLLNTHTHFDHVGINNALAERGALGGVQVAGPARKAADVPHITRPLDEGDSLRVGELEVQVWRTEGHIDGHISFVLDGAVFCGDTLFTGGCGYLFDGPPETMFDSLLRLASLPGETRVCCAHEYTEDNLAFAWFVEPDNAALAARIRDVWARRAEGECTVPSTIAIERATNPFLRPGAASLRARVAEELADADLSTAAATFAATRRLKDTRKHRKVELSLPLG